MFVSFLIGPLAYLATSKKTLEKISSVFLVEDVNTFPNRYSHSRVAQNR